MPSQKVIITKSKLDDLASAISNKSGANIPLTIDQMTTAVENISTSGSSINLQTKNVTPTESSQTITPDSGYNGLSSVSVGAISTTYVGSGIARKSSSDLTSSNLTVTAPAGYYEQAATKTVTDANLIAGNIKNGTSIFGVTGTYETPFETPTFTLTLTNNWSTLSSITCDKTYSECVNYTSYNNNTWYARILWTDGTYTQKLSGAIYHDNNTANSPYYCYVETVTEGVASYKIIYTSNGTITWEENPVELIDCPKFTLSNNGATVTCNKTFAECTTYINNGIFIGAIINPDSSVQAIMFDDGTENTIVYKMTAIASGYGIGIGTLTYSSSGTITLDNTQISERSSSDLTASGATITAPAGYYPSAATKTIASGTEGTPTATKGSVSNHAISVTPSVTNTAGYISGGTHSGTAVSVSASELVSGTKSISANGTGIDVTNYASVDVSVSPSLQAKTNISPTESSQTISADNGYDGLSSVQINAISSTYVGSGITSRSSSDLSANGDTVTVPAGYYSAQATKAVSSMTLPTAATSSATSGYTSKATISRSTSDQYINIPTGYNTAGAYYKISAVANGTASGPSTISGTSATVSTGTNTLTLTKTVSVTPTVSAGYVSNGTATNSSVSLTASVTTKAAATITPTTTNQTIASGTYLTGTQTISGDANLVASNIISGKSIFGVSGSVVIQHYYTGSSTPSSSTGVNGDIYLKTS